MGLKGAYLYLVLLQVTYLFRLRYFACSSLVLRGVVLMNKQITVIKVLNLHFKKKRTYVARISLIDHPSFHSSNDLFVLISQLN